MQQIDCSNCEEANDSSSKYCHRCGQALPQTPISTTSAATPVKPAPSKGRWKIVVGLVVGIAVVSALFYLAKSVVDNPNTINPILLNETRVVNSSCPIMIDAETQLNNAVALPGDVFQYNYTLINMDHDQIDAKAMEENLKPNLLNNAATHPDLEMFRQLKVTLVYYYADRSGNHILKITITPEDYMR